MENNLDRCIDSRGKEYLKDVLNELKELIGGYQNLLKIYSSLALDVPSPSEEELEKLVDSVNPIRLKNNPVALSKKAIKEIYIKSLKK